MTKFELVYTCFGAIEDLHKTGTGHTSPALLSGSIYTNVYKI